MSSLFILNYKTFLAFLNHIVFYYIYYIDTNIYLDE
jgi:hypothetical protein